MNATGSVLCFKTEGLVVGGKGARKENRQLGQVGWSRQAAERVEDSLPFPVWSKDWLSSPPIPNGTASAVLGTQSCPELGTG